MLSQNCLYQRRRVNRLSDMQTYPKTLTSNRKISVGKKTATQTPEVIKWDAIVKKVKKTLKNNLEKGWVLNRKVKRLSLHRVHRQLDSEVWKIHK